MIISYGRPSDMAASINGGDAAFVDGSVTLFDGRPGSQTALTWSSGAQSTSTAVNIDTVWATAIVPRVIGIIGTTLPVGTLIEVKGKRSGDTGYPYDLGTVDTVRVSALPRGERIAWLVLDEGLDACIGVRVTIYNDVNSSTGLTAGAEYRLGELWVGAGGDLSITPDWGVTYEDATTTAESDTLQPWAQRKTPRRVLRFTPCVRAQSDVFGTADSGFDLEQWIAQLDRGQQAVFIPRYRDSAGDYDSALAHRTAVLGSLAAQPGAKHLAGPWYGPTEWQVKEAPVPV